MTEYVKSTNFTSKDSLSSGNPLKIVKGTEFDTEFNNIATAVATKADIADPTFTGVPAAPTASAGTSTTQLATTAFVAAAVSTAVTAYDTALTVSTSQIENSAVTEAKVADNAITAAKIATGAVGADELATDAVTQAKMANSSVGTAEIIDANVTAAKLSGAQSGSAPVYGARAWAMFNPSGTLQAGGNIASVVKASTGVYTVTLTTAMADANYAVVATQHSTTNLVIITQTVSSTVFTVICQDPENPDVYGDSQCSVVVYR